MNESLREKLEELSIDVKKIENSEDYFIVKDMELDMSWESNLIDLLQYVYEQYEDEVILDIHDWLLSSKELDILRSDYYGIEIMRGISE